MSRKGRKIKPWSKRFYVQKKKRPAARNYDDPLYKNWRKQVFVRDGYKCQWPGCTCGKRINAHHILKWADYPGMRFVLMNGITLCKKHHDQVKGREDYYVKFFSELLRSNEERKRDEHNN